MTFPDPSAPLNLPSLMERYGFSENGLRKRMRQLEPPVQGDKPQGQKQYLYSV